MATYFWSFRELMLNYRIKRMGGQMKTIYPSVFNKAEVRKEQDRLHDHYFLVPADICNTV